MDVKRVVKEVRIDDDLVAEINARAEASGSTVTDLVNAILRQALAPPPEAPPPE